MLTRESLQQYFNADYKGIDSFIDTILKPIFGEDDIISMDGDLCDEEEIRIQASKANILSIKYAAQIRALGIDVNVFDITLSDNCRIQSSRKGIQSLVRQFVQRFEGAFLLFHYEDTTDRSWRLSYLEKRSTNNDSTSAKRFTYLCGRDFSCRTLADRLLLLKDSNFTAADFETAFSVEALTLEFYKKLFRWYMWAIDDRTGVTFPNRTNTDQDDREDIQRKMIRLITRLLFVWFIKQKHLVPNNLFDEEKLKNILRDFDPQSRTDSNYYNAILQNLFFATLNQEIQDRRFIEDRQFQGKSDNYGDKVLYRDNKKQSWFVYPEDKKKDEVIRLFHSIPYLNGGLFECLDKFDIDPTTGKYLPIKYYDGFSSKDTKSQNGNLKYRAFIPNILFFAPEHKEPVDMGDGHSEELEVCGLIEIFRQYNFTTEENTTTDAEVSLDPELLGKVFENLLAAYNPETKDSVRKSTGSYYTPREIVDYMVDESLIAYLTEQCGHDANTIRTIFSDEQAPVPATAKQIADDLRAVKVLDPACGSGAFPMGILIRVTNIIERLEPDIFNRYETKLQLIKNCIYGIDIQPIAMLICKLRFFISLICDSEYRPDDVEGNYGITPLPNLETKFVAANSLLPAKLHEYDNDMQNDLLGDPELKQMQQQLLDLRRGIFDLHTKKQKLANRRQDQQLCQQISDYIKREALQPDEQKIEGWKRTISECETMLPKVQGERIQRVITQDLFGGEKVEYLDLNKKQRDELQARIRSCQASIKAERNKSVPNGFMEAVEQVTLWNPYDQNQSSPFFDAKWMFGIGVDTATTSRASKQGFDIVIGNPPYGATLTDEEVELFKVLYNDVHMRTPDTYNYFISRGIRLLSPNASLSYIVPNTLLSQNEYQKTRILLTTYNSLQYVVNLGDHIFEAAEVPTCIIVVNKSENTFYTINYADYKDVDNSKIQWGSNYQFIPNQILENIPGRVIGVDINNANILQKVRENSVTIDSIAYEMAAGISTGCNKAFCVTEEQIQAHCIERGILRPLLIGRDIDRYSIQWNSQYIIYTTKETEIEQYPNAEKFALPYKEKLDKRRETRKGLIPWWALNWPRYEALFKGAKIIMRQTSDSIQAVFDDKDYYPLNSILTLRLNDNCGYSYKFVLGILNSKLCNFIYQNISQEKGRTFAEVKPINVRKLFIPNIKENQQAQIIALVDTILAKKKQNQQADTTAEESQIDKVVYQLYNLTDDEIRLIEQA